MHKPYNTEKTLIVNTHANLLASTTIYGPDFELSPSDTDDAGKHKICNGINTYAELPFIEDAVVGSPTWGSIGGTLTNQSDLVTALGAKQNFRLELGAVHSLGTATASAATLDLTPGTIGGDTVPITGTATIASLGSGCPLGTIRRLVFDDVLVLTNSTDLILPGGVDHTTTAGDALVFVCINEAAGKWRCVGVSRNAVAPQLAVDGSTGPYIHDTLNGVVSGGNGECVFDLSRYASAQFVSASAVETEGYGSVIDTTLATYTVAYIKGNGATVGDGNAVVLNIKALI